MHLSLVVPERQKWRLKDIVTSAIFQVAMVFQETLAISVYLREGCYETLHCKCWFGSENLPIGSNSAVNSVYCDFIQMPLTVWFNPDAMDWVISACPLKKHACQCSGILIILCRFSYMGTTLSLWLNMIHVCRKGVIFSEDETWLEVSNFTANEGACL